MDEFEVEYLFRDCNNQFEIAMKFLDLSQSPETCVTLRNSGCVPLIVQIIHSDADEITKSCAIIALQNIVGSHSDDKVMQTEATALRHIETIVRHSDSLKSCHSSSESIADNDKIHPLEGMYKLSELSFDEIHRHAMYQFGALQAIVNLVNIDHTVHGHSSTDEDCISLRKYACRALTRLTSGNGSIALLYRNREFMKSVVAQLNSDSDDLLQVTATLLGNLLCRIDHDTITILHEVGIITALTKAAMKNENEKTLQTLLSLLLILSAYGSSSKAEICAVDGALEFLIDMIGSSKSLSVVELASGILRRIACRIAVNGNYRQILRERNCLKTLLQHLSSESLTVVGNACGTLWNLSVGCPKDRKFLCDHKAVFMLGLLTDSKHKSISDGSRATLKNLLNFRPDDYRYISNFKSSSDTVTKSIQLKELPSLNLRKQRTLDEDLKTRFLLSLSSPPNDEGTISNNFVPLNDNVNQPQSSEVVDLNAIAKSTSVPTRFVSLKGSITLIKTASIVVRDSEKFYQTKVSSYIHRVFIVSKESVAPNLEISSDRMVVEPGTDPPDKLSKPCKES